MLRNPITRTMARCIITVGIILAALLAGGAPSDHINSVTTVEILPQ